MELPRPRFGRSGLDWLDRGQIIALSGVIARELAAEPDATVNGLAMTVEAAWETLSHYPDLDAIAECCAAGPGDPCAFCDRESWHDSEPQELPEWILQARAEREAAILTLTAIAEAGDTLKLSDDQSLGEWLGRLYYSDHAEFIKTYQVLARDSSPQSAAAIEEARQIVFGNRPAPDQPPAAPAPLPGGNMSHTLAAGPSQRRHTLGVQRNHYDLEGHRHRRATGDKPRRRRGRRRLR
jgi:hypothetical protein